MMRESLQHRLPSDVPLRVGVLEDEPLMRDMLADLLTDAKLQVAVCESEVEPFLRAVDAAPQGSPGVASIDVAIIDLRIERAGVGVVDTGLKAVRVLRERHPEVRQLVLSGLDSPRMTQQALEAGAHAFLSKLRVGRSQVVEAVRALAADEPLPASHFEVPPMPQAKGAGGVHLTPRELDVLRHVAVGMDNLKVAAHLGITERTVKAHVCSLYAKLRVENRAEMALKGYELGLRPASTEPPERS